MVSIYNTNTSLYIAIVTSKYFSTILFLRHQRIIQDWSKVSLELVKVPLEKDRQNIDWG